ncbi:MAG: HMA2 domain-containing protein [candidate division NC10 bacterium]
MLPHPVRVFRYGNTLSTWELAHWLTGRVRLRHPALQARPEIADALQDSLCVIDGVRSTRVVTEACSLVIGFDPLRTDWLRLLPILEDILIHAWPAGVPGRRRSSRRAIMTARLAMAAASDAGVPGVQTLMTGWQILRALPIWKEACRDLRGGAINHRAVDSARLSLSLLKGRFLPGALADWLSLHWDDDSRDRLAQAARRLAARQWGGRSDAVSPRELRRIQAFVAAVRDADHAPAFPRFDDQAALPLLLAGVVAWLLGGPARCAGVLRADFQTGPLLARRQALLERLQPDGPLGADGTIHDRSALFGGTIPSSAIPSLVGALGALAGLWGSYTNIALGQMGALQAHGKQGGTRPVSKEVRNHPV